MKILFDYSKLRGLIKEKYGSEKRFADHLSFSSVTLNRRLNNHAFFDQNEIMEVCHLLDIPDYKKSEYFFTPIVRKTEPKEMVSQ